MKVKFDNGYISAFLIFIILIINLKFSYSQECKDFHKRNLCYRAAFIEGFNYYGQSASALIEKDITIKYSAVFYGGKDYLIFFCCLPEFYPVHYTIYDADTQELIYDNEEDEYIDRVGFTIEYTRSLTIEITPIATNIYADGLDRKVRGCLGVLIQWKKAPKLGF